MLENNIQKTKNLKYLSVAVLCLIILQPLLDILSYWLDYFASSNTITLALRFLLFIIVFITGFNLSDKKKHYWAVIIVGTLIFCGHVVTCILNFSDYSFTWAYTDFANFVRVIQIPVFTLAFITLLKRSNNIYNYFEKGLFINICIIIAVEIISTITGTDPHTYPNKSIGMLGWFYFANSQSAILTGAMPIAIIYLYKKGNQLITSAFTILYIVILYMFGTRLTYLGIFVITIGIVISLFTVHGKSIPKIYIVILCLLALLSGLFYSSAPFYNNQSKHQEILKEEQEDIDSLLVYDETGEVVDISKVYENYLGGLVHKFGFERVAKEYDSSYNASEIIDVRKLKLEYNHMLMQDSPIGIKIFGLPLESLTYEDYIYDVENDWHGIYYLFGYSGLFALLAFCMYFIFIILIAIIKDFRKYFTIEAAGVGISLIMLFVHVYFTAGVLRRPNASFYVSISLALAYYLVKVKGEVKVIEE